MSPLLLYTTMVVLVGFQEEFAPLAGALAAHHGHGEIWLVAAACAAGAWLHGLALYYVGHRGRTVLQRPALQRALGLVRRHQIPALLGSRLAYGLRLTIPVACGAADVPFGLFALLTALSSAVWAGLFCTIGWFAGELAVSALHDLRHYEVRAGGVLIFAGLLFFLWRRRRTQADTGEPAIL